MFPDLKRWWLKMLIFYNHRCFVREGRLISKIKIQNHFVTKFCGIWFALSGCHRQDLKKTLYVIHCMPSPFSASNTNEYSLLCYWPLKRTLCVFVWLPECQKLQIFLLKFLNRLNKEETFLDKNFCVFVIFELFREISCRRKFSRLVIREI